VGAGRQSFGGDERERRKNCELAVAVPENRLRALLINLRNQFGRLGERGGFEKNAF